MSKCKTVVITRAELMPHVTSQRGVEHFVNLELRRHGIPAIGLFQYKGIRTGVLSVKRDQVTNDTTFKWWPSAKDALDDGVVVPDSPKSELTI